MMKDTCRLRWPHIQPLDFQKGLRWSRKGTLTCIFSPAETADLWKSGMSWKLVRSLSPPPPPPHLCDFHEKSEGILSSCLYTDGDEKLSRHIRNARFRPSTLRWVARAPCHQLQCLTWQACYYIDKALSGFRVVFRSICYQIYLFIWETSSILSKRGA